MVVEDRSLLRFSFCHKPNKNNSNFQIFATKGAFENKGMKN